jgi:hypothetical protein
MITTYAELQTEIATNLRRDNLSGNIPTMIKLAEERMKNDLRVWQMIQSTTRTVVAESNEASVPTDMLSIKSMYYNNAGHSYELTALPLAALKEQYNTSGNPKHYAVHGANFVFYPTPAEDFTVELEYMGFPTALSNGNPSNSILLAYPTIYLYGSLIYGYDLVRHAEQREVAIAYYNAAVAAANLTTQKRNKGAVTATYRPFSRSRRIP